MWLLLVKRLTKSHQPNRSVFQRIVRFQAFFAFFCLNQHITAKRPVRCSLKSPKKCILSQGTNNNQTWKKSLNQLWFKNHFYEVWSWFHLQVMVGLQLRHLYTLHFKCMVCENEPINHIQISDQQIGLAPQIAMVSPLMSYMH